MTIPRAPISSVAEINPRKWSIAPKDDDIVSFVPMASVEVATGRLDPSTQRPWSEVKKGYRRFEEGDVLVAKITPSMENGKAALATGLAGGRGAGSTEFHVLRAGPKLDPQYLLHFVLQASTRRDARSHMKGVAGQLRVPPEFFSKYEIPLPILAEQKQIVAAIETQFDRLDDAVAALERARIRLKRYRASVLESATSGTLLGASTHDNADVLNSVGEDASESEYIGRITTFLESRLPIGWCVTTIEGIAEPSAASITDGPFGSNLKSAHYTESGPRVIRLQNIGDNEFLNHQAHISPEHYERLIRHKVQQNDVVVAILGSPLPRSCVIPDGVAPAIVKADCVRIRVDQSKAHPHFISYVLNSETIRGLIGGLVHGVGRPRISLRTLKPFPFMLPPLAEQERIVEEVERRMSVIEQMETTVEANLKRAESLRQSILRRAFSGRLDIAREDWT